MSTSNESVTAEPRPPAAAADDAPIPLPPVQKPPTVQAEPELQRRLAWLDGALWVLVLVLAFLLGSFAATNSDLWMHLALGRDLLSGVSEKVLTAQLRKLEQDGILRRRVTPSVPPRVDYELTLAGWELIPIMQSMCDWGSKHSRHHAYSAAHGADFGVISQSTQQPRAQRKSLRK